MGTLSLWVSALGSERTGWTRVGTNPYLNAQDQPTHYVYSIVKKAEIGNFDFQDTAQTGTINSVTLYVYGQTAVAGNLFYISVDGGAVWTSYNPTLPATWGWTSVAVPIIDTWDKLNAAKMYIYHPNSTSRTDIDAAYLYVDYSLAATPYSTNVRNIGTIYKAYSTQTRNIGTIFKSYLTQVRNIGTVFKSYAAQVRNIGTILAAPAAYSTEVRLIGTIYKSFSAQVRNIGTILGIPYSTQVRNIGTVFKSYSTQVRNIGTIWASYSTQARNIGTIFKSYATQVRNIGTILPSGGTPYSATVRLIGTIWAAYTAKVRNVGTILGFAYSTKVRNIGTILPGPTSYSEKVRLIGNVDPPNPATISGRGTVATHVSQPLSIIITPNGQVYLNLDINKKTKENKAW